MLRWFQSCTERDMEEMSLNKYERCLLQLAAGVPQLWVVIKGNDTSAVIFAFFQLFDQKMNLCQSKWSPSRKIHGQFVMEILLRWQNHFILHNLFLLPVFYYETPWHLPWPKSMKLNCLSFNHDNCNYKTFMWNISVSDGNIVNKQSKRLGPTLCLWCLNFI